MLSSSVIAAFVGVPFVATYALAANACTRTYTVKQGDICDSISAAHNVSTYQLASINSPIDARCGNLIPGEVLCLGTKNEDCSTTYVVRKDDTCGGIAFSHGINSTILHANNPQIDSECSNVYIGEVLCVAGKVQVPPAPATGIPAKTIPATAANPTTTKPITSSHASTSTHQAPAATVTQFVEEDGDDDDDDQLPFCDEL